MNSGCLQQLQPRCWPQKPSDSSVRRHFRFAAGDVLEKGFGGCIGCRESLRTLREGLTYQRHSEPDLYVARVQTSQDCAAEGITYHASGADEACTPP